MTTFYTNVRQYGKSILYRGVENGKRVARRIEYRPTLYIPSKKKSKFHTLEGVPVEPVEPGNINDCKEFIERYSSVDNFDIYGFNRYDYAYISDMFGEDDIHLTMDDVCTAYVDIEVDSKNGFPEVKTAAEVVTAITVKIRKEIHTFGVGKFSIDEITNELVLKHKDHISYYECQSESELLYKFVEFWSLQQPDVLTGWNSKFFDVPYLVNRITNILGDDVARKLSPWKIVKMRTTNVMNREQITYDMFGIAQLDYIDLFKWFSSAGPQESYRLDYIAQVVLGENKLDYSEYENLHQFHTENYQKYIEYNIHDVLLVERLNDKERLLELAFTLAYDNKVNFEDVFTQVRMWDNIIYNYLRKENIVVPQLKFGEKNFRYEGAFVKDPIVGMHDWVASFDLNSLYPHLIMQYNISMETLIEPKDYTNEMTSLVEAGRISVDSLLEENLDLSFLKEQKATITPNAQFFRVDKQGILPKIMQAMYDDRKKYKKMAIEAKKKLETIHDDPLQKEYVEKEISRYENLQLVKKVTLNSAYGALGSQYFRYYDLRMAEGITRGGQLAIRWIEKYTNGYLNKLLKTDNKDYVIACDTDSMYLRLDGLVKSVYPDGVETRKGIRFLNKVCEQKLQPFIDNSYKELSEYTNAFSQKMVMKRESLCDKAIWTAKKRYILNVYDSEGVEYEKPKIKITGLEAIKSSTPSACRKKIKEAISVILGGEEEKVIDFIAEFRKDFAKLPPEEVAFPRSVNGLAEYSSSSDLFKKGAPIHVKGSLLYNQIVKNNGLEKKYELIKEGEKIKFCYLKQPNPFRNNTIAFINTLPKELEVDAYLDRDVQFEKSFVEPLKIILDSIGWRTEKTSSLMDFF